MGRESRQSRRARERREQELRRKQSRSDSRNWRFIAGAAAIGAAILIAAGLAATILSGGLPEGRAAATSSTVPTPVESPGKVIDGLIGCNPGMENGTVYHIHMHLSIYDAGKPITVPAYVGFNYQHDCLYWLHTHDNSGIIHLEAPNGIKPDLGNFFDVWGEPLSTTRVASATVKPGEKMKIWVDQKPYFGNPRTITLTRHKNIYIEVGPPFVPPKPFNFDGL